MATSYPGSLDSFNEPSEPEGTPLSEAGAGNTRNHFQHHRDLGDAMEALEANASLKAHDHSGDGTTAHGVKLLQANTHQTPDTDSSPSALHHTLDTPTGATANKAAPADHVHDYNNGTRLTNRPYILCTSVTRPGSPFLGLMIYETDTNRVRVWAQFPGQDTPIWQLLPVGTVPVLRAESRVEVEVVQNQRHTCFFTHILEDLFGMCGAVHNHHQEPRVVGNITDLVVPESGHYWVHSRFHWHPQHCYHDHSMIEMTVNGVDVGRKDWEFVRGYSYVPGFGQSINLNMLWYFDAGDILRVHVKHNGSNRSRLWWHDLSPDKQHSYLDLYFNGP